MAMLDEMQVVGIKPTNFTLSVVVKLAVRCKTLEYAFDVCDKAFAVFRQTVGEGARPE